MEDIGGMLMPILNNLVGYIQSLVSAWQNLDGGLKIAIITFAGILAAIGPVIGIFGMLMTAIGFIASPIGLVVVSIAAITAALIYAADNMEALKEVGSMVFATLQNAVISFIQFLVENNPFALLIEGYNFVAEAFGKDKITFFDDVSDSLEGLKMKIPEVSTEFGSFSDAVSNAATKAKKALFGLGSGLGVGSTTAQGSTAESAPTISTTGLDLEEMEEEAEFVDTTYGDSLIAMTEKMTALKDATKEFGLAMVNDFAGSMASAVVSGENFFESMKNIFVDMAKQISAMIIKAAILAAVFAMIPGMGAAQAAGGGATNFMGLLTGSLTGKASGGSVVTGQPYMVGESGPEMFMPGQSGTIIPNNNVSGGNSTPDVTIRGNDLLILFDRANRIKNRR